MCTGTCMYIQFTGRVLINVYAMVLSDERDSRTKEHNRNNAVHTLESIVFLCPHFFFLERLDYITWSMESVKLEGQRKVLTLIAINVYLRTQIYRYKNSALILQQFGYGFDSSIKPPEY